MSARTCLTARIAQYLVERRHLGFELKHMGQSLARFARYVKACRHRGPLTVELMASWARQAKGGRGDGVCRSCRRPAKHPGDDRTPAEHAEEIRGRHALTGS